MLGLLLIYFLGKYFYDLALQYNKPPWKYAVIGILSYYLGIALGGAFMGIMLEWTSPGSIDRINDWLLGLICIPFGLLIAKLTHLHLQKRFANPPRRTDANLSSSILDEEFMA